MIAIAIAVLLVIVIDVITFSRHQNDIERLKQDVDNLYHVTAKHQGAIAQIKQGRRRG